VVVVVDPGSGGVVVGGVGADVVVVDGAGVHPGTFTTQSARAPRAPIFAPTTSSRAVRPTSVRILAFRVTVTCSVGTRKGLSEND
jgi:hypothetical protein